MTPEQQRIAIAEACGWTEISMRCMWGLPPHAFDYGTEDCLKHIPDYLSDLNAMHEATLAKLNGPATDGWRFMENLRLVCGIPHSSVCMALVCATAAQRAEAFLRTIGKWVES